MKKLLVLVMVLGMVASANAALQLSVNGQVDHVETIMLVPSDEIVLDIHGDGQDSNPTPYLIVRGPGNINGGVILYDPTSTLADYKDAEELLATYWAPMTMEEALGFIRGPTEEGGWGLAGTVDFALAEIISDKTIYIPPTTGLLADEIIFHCDGIGVEQVLLINVGVDEFDLPVVTVLDSLIIYSDIPEPMTVALLGLGGLFLRRRK